MVANNIEILVFIVALFFSKDKLTILMLITFALFVSFLNNIVDINYDSAVELCETGSVSYDYCDKMLMMIYIMYAVSFLCISSLFLLLSSKITAITSIFIALHGVSFLAMIPVIWMVMETGDTYDWLFNIHSYIENVFVTAYCVIAWVCVYYSRKV